jgi:hypothetical protein
VRLRALTAGAVPLIAALAGCGAGHSAPSHGRRSSATAVAALVREARPIGRGRRFRPADRGPVLGPCRPRLGPRYGVHVELFAADRVVMVAAGIGTRPPRRRFEGRIANAGCYGNLVTLEPTGVVLLRPGARLSLGALFRSWGQPLTRRRLGPFAARAGQSVVVFVGGRRWTAAPGEVPLVRHSEIVLEVGPRVPPHVRYAFPPGS